MAGIGFELKKLFEHKGALAMLRAYGYTAVVCIGPMLLSITLLIGLRFLSFIQGADRQLQDLLVTMITYCLLGSLVLTNVLSMVTTRYAADMMYEEKPQLVLPSLYGSLMLLLVAGSTGYGTFLAFSGISLWNQALCLVLFCELTIVWTQMNYMMAVKDYRSILVVFACGVLLALLYGYAAVCWLGLDTVTALMSAIILGYGVIMVGFFVLLHRYFPRGEGSIFRFLAWIDRYPALLFVGLFLTVGLFAHLVITWSSPLGVQIKGLFFAAPQYDIPAITAFMSLLVSTINFTVSVEVNFYPRYRQYINLFNEGGALSDIELAQSEMLLVLRQEISYLAYRQFVVTVLFIIVGAPLLVGANMGFSETMIGTYRILCVGYGLYAIANSMLLIQLYFSDNAGAFWTSLAFMAACIAGTLIFVNGELIYYGFGFLAACTVMYAVAWIRLWRFTGKLQHHMLSAQPVLQQASLGAFTRLSQMLNKKDEEVQVRHGYRFTIKYRGLRRSPRNHSQARGRGPTI